MDSMLIEPPVRVFLAMSAPLPRARLRNLLMDADNIEIVGEAGSGALAAERAVDSKPDILLVDDRILADQSIEMFARMQGTPPACKFVLLTPNPQAVSYRGPVPVAALVPIDTAGPWLRQRLDAVVRHAKIEPRPVETATRVAGMESRFVVHPNMQHSAGSRDVTKRLNDEVRDLTRPPAGENPFPGPSFHALEPDILATRRLDGGGRRTTSLAGNRLTERLAATVLHLEQQKDSVTGLFNTKVLGGALRTISEVGYQAAVLVIHLWYSSRRGAALDFEVEPKTVRTAAALLKTNVRHEDVVCRLEGFSFAVVLPGITTSSAPAAVHRVLSAFNRLTGNQEHEDVVLEVAHGIGYWIPPMSAAEPLDQAWRSMVADRNAQTRR
jgi:diguanylate cyclase (GGDEF)-like protein